MTYGTMEKIETVTVGSGGAANIEFTNIPQTYDDLVIVVSARTSNSATSDTVTIDFNGLSTNQTSRRLRGTGSAADSNSYSRLYFVVNGNTSTSSTFSNSSIYIPNYRSSLNKSLSIDTVFENNATGANQELWAGLWSSTAAITIVTISGQSTNFLQHSTAYLYGVTRVPAGAKATGGVITDDASYWYHTFTSSGVFTPSQNLTADCLVVAGGGGAGGHLAGGGGAGGLRNLSNGSFNNVTTYTIAVGAGGAGVLVGGTPTQGGNSSISGAGFITYSATGGGFGGDNNGGNGGSGGGRAGNAGTTAGTGNAGSYSPVEGYNGGNNAGGVEPNRIAGGGGGASEAGNTDGQGFGGDGSSSYSSWGFATSTGQNINGTYWYAGGGGGSADYNGSTSTREGGLGGGGNSVRQVAGVSGTANTGGGGGAGSYNGVHLTGGSGGSGIVIIRYAK